MSEWVATRLIAEYSQPGGIVLDTHPNIRHPDLLLAGHQQNRHAIGITRSSRQAALTDASIRLTVEPEQPNDSDSDGGRKDGELLPPAPHPVEVRVVTALTQPTHDRPGQPQVRLADSIADLGGRVALLVHDYTVATQPTGGSVASEADPAAVGWPLEEVLDAATELLHTGAVLVCLSRQPLPGQPFRDHAGAVTRAASNRGLTYLQHVIALTGPAPEVDSVRSTSRRGPRRDHAASTHPQGSAFRHPMSEHLDVCVFLRA